MRLRSEGAQLSERQLHEAFLAALGSAVLSYSDVSVKPLEVDLCPPLPHRARLYIFNCTAPPGGRPSGEHKIQLRVYGQKPGDVGSFDTSGGRQVLLLGYKAVNQVFVLWDADLYPTFAYARNVQVQGGTIDAAACGLLAQQERTMRFGMGREIVLAARADRLREALIRRLELTRDRLLQG